MSADPEPVQGCKMIELGSLQYVACASTDFVARHFNHGVNGDSLAQAPHLRFDRRDTLQTRWAREAHRIDIAAPVHWVPSTHGFLDLTLSGLGWSLQPLPMIGAHMDAGRLVELPPRLRIDVKLYWIVSRLHTSTLHQLTRAVRAAAARELQ